MTLVIPQDEIRQLLTPGKYWLTVPGVAWNTYRRLLKLNYGSGSFRTIETHEEKHDGQVLVMWVVIEVFKPIEVDPEIVGVAEPFKPGDNFHNTGAIEVPQPHWMATASDAVEVVKEAGGKIASGLPTVLWGGATLAIGLGFLVGKLK